MILLDLPFPLSLNLLYPSAKNGRRFLSPKGKEYHEKVIWACRQQLGSYEPLTGRIKLRMDLFPPDNRRFDISNRIKICEDALTEARVWEDDSQVDELTVVRMPPDTLGYVTVTISEIK